MKAFFKFVFSKLFLKQLIIATVIFIILFVSAVVALRIYTQHGRTVQVPDFYGYSEAQVARLVDKEGFHYVIVDSLNTTDVDPGAVFNQVPSAGTQVKKGRKIFLVVNSKSSEMVVIPHLRNVSLRQARALITQADLKVGEIVFIPSEFKGLVLRQLMGDSIVLPGAKVPKWSEVDLHVGKGLGTVNIAMPYLRGMYWVDARKEISDLSLNEGSLVNDASIIDVTNNDSSIVWKQYPQPGVLTKVGKGIDVWLTMDTAVVYAADTTLKINNSVIDD